MDSFIQVLRKLKEKGVGVADEVLANNCNWSIRKVKLRDLVLPDGGSVAEACKGVLGVASDGKIVAVKEGDKYRVIAGVDTIKALVCERRTGLDAEVEAYVAECEGEPEAEDACATPSAPGQTVKVRHRSQEESRVEVSLNLEQNSYLVVNIFSKNAGFLHSIKKGLRNWLSEERYDDYAEIKLRREDFQGPLKYYLIVQINIVSLVIDICHYSPETCRTCSMIKEHLNKILDEIREAIQKETKKHKIQNVDYINFDAQSIEEIINILVDIIKKLLENENENLLTL